MFNPQNDVYQSYSGRYEQTMQNKFNLFIN